MATSAQAPLNPPSTLPASVTRWLFAVYAMVFTMVLVGGITRLTGSGLSMVEWHPLMGALPPLSEAEWLDTFARYQQSPQFREVNHWMTLGDFQRIFFWEYLHRVLGRLIGVVFFVPWLAFVLLGKLRGRDLWRTAIAFLLGGAQGLLGWFMVKSGLVDVPEVSHFRLAAHLSLAFFVGHYVLWLILDAKPRELGADLGAVRSVARATVAFIVVLGLQIVYGAFMAGTRAGWLFQTFPDMNGSLFPTEPLAGLSLGHALAEHPVGIHAMHRTLAYLVLALGVALFVYARRRAQTRAQRLAVRLLVVAVSAQFLLGVLTVMLAVPTPIAVAHQAGAYLLLSATVAVLHAFRPVR